MGLRFTDKDSWAKWQASRRRLHVLKDRLTGKRQEANLDLAFWARGDAPALLVACDSNSPTNHHSLLAPLGTELPAVVVMPTAVSLKLPGEGWRRLPALDALQGSITALASIGDHLPVGDWAHRLARRRDWQQWVVQHGLLTPFAPPPPPGVTVLTWSDADSEFLRKGRPDLTFVTVGSPMLAAAAAAPAPHVSRFERPVFLGQLHGAELSRWSMTRSATAFWRRTGATYRPHPREEDKLSRAQHAIWRRMGMEIDSGGRLADLNRPVVAAFSTGVLEAAARGIPAWVFHLDPPAWLEEFWERYGMRRWGDEPTRARSETSEPQSRIQQLLNGERFHQPGEKEQP